MSRTMERGDTLYLAYEPSLRRWVPCNNVADQRLAEGQTVVECYVVNVFEPQEPPPRKVPHYRPTYKPMVSKHRKPKPMMPIQVH